MARRKRDENDDEDTMPTTIPCPPPPWLSISCHESTYSMTLTSADFDTLQEPTEDLGANVVNCMLWDFWNRHTELQATEGEDPTVACIPSTAWHKWRQGNGRAPPAVYSTHSLLSYHYLVLPVQLDASWVLTVIVNLASSASFSSGPVKTQIIVFDPLVGQENDAQSLPEKDFLEPLCAMLVKMLASVKLRKKKWPIVFASKIPGIDNGYQELCGAREAEVGISGFYVLHYASCFFREPEAVLNLVLGDRKPTSRQWMRLWEPVAFFERRELVAKFRVLRELTEFAERFAKYSDSSKGPAAGKPAAKRLKATPLTEANGLKNNSGSST